LSTVYVLLEYDDRNNPCIYNGVFSSINDVKAAIAEISEGHLNNYTFTAKGATIQVELTGPKGWEPSGGLVWLIKAETL
jgi:hypothetical protein